LEFLENQGVCRYFYLDSIDKIAEKYGLSDKNVSKILSRTRIKLREYLINKGYFI
jgi:DNA-directed RNA polymerase specialized sigma subunit